MKNKILNDLLIFMIVILIICSMMLPIVIGYNDKQIINDAYFDNLASICYDERGFFNEEKYNQLRQYESLHNVEIEENSKLPEPLQTSTPNGLMDSAWPMKCHNLRHTGLSPHSTADNPLTEKWRFRLERWADTGISIDNEGILYFGAGDDAFPWYLFAVYPNGTEKWRYNTGGLLIGASPAIAEDGTIYMPSWSHHLHALYPNGALKWKFDASVDIYSSPAIADDGTIYFGTFDGVFTDPKIFAVNPDGTEKWSYTTGNSITSDPAIGDDGTIYIGSDDYYLYALYPNGTLKWRFLTGDVIRGPVSIADDGTIYFGSYDDYIYALYPDGSLRWQTEISYGSDTNPSIASDGTIYIASANDLFAIYPNNGTIKWVFDLGGHVGSSSSAISADGTIFTGTQIGSPGEGGEIVAVNPDGTERWRKILSNKWVESSPCIGSDGTVYICSSSLLDADGYGYLHAFNEADLSVDAGGPYYGIPDTPIQFDSTTFGGVPSYEYLWDFGDDETSTEEDPVHVYDESGEYTIILTVTDSVMNISFDTTYVNVNDPPNNPIISGETTGQFGQPYEYTFSAVDPQDEDVYFRINWGDTDYLDWFGPFESGEEVKINHTYESQGTYNLICWARDIHEERSDPTTLEVTMPVNQQSTHPWLHWFLERFPNAFPILRNILEL